MQHRIVNLTGEEAWSRRADVRNIYRHAFGCSPEEADGFVIGSFTHVREYVGATLLLAEVEDVPVGMLYGYTYEPHQWWSQRVAAPIIRAGYREYLDDAFSLAELAVLPEYQGQGIGTALLGHQLATQPQEFVLLSTDADPTVGAASLYEKYGFRVIVSLFSYSENSAAAHIMGAQIDANSTKR